MRLPNAVQQEHPWVISRIAPDFQLLDVWALPVRGRANDFPTLLEVMADLDPTGAGSTASRALFWLRFRVGALFGWDDPHRKFPVPGRVETSLTTRVPEDLRATARGLKLGVPGFVPLYRTNTEAAAEVSNATVHGVLHLAWVHQGNGRYRGQMAVYVKPRGWLGDMYMALIGPFRYLIVYPALMRQIENAWQARRAGPTHSGHAAQHGLSRVESQAK
ncbi:MAG: DUF2867 domain-containing protein [Candidatus Dormibacteraeota bacterium]|uniref:DUF2867 domain-containing protein n=1 Tax=Candidatus Aeolococcus gillhamiae TaxID=3127015 RepID=A0A2W5Z8D5_9BACT|nr:DUF2867 domain-containing protein [Candidatus Dormibacteraeota bacterium]PZR81640.1 MAG: DUF2867 domain-containing protein [Candidatus Dormibacter sp. RRmetagenome_bin12]